MPKGTFFILLYHRVIPKDTRDIDIQPGMYVLPEIIKMHINYLKKKYAMKPLKY